ncbi:Hypothetical_protein [Hexamita inflata]|uniref:Hypothetical_protein n=1 Tax=Hexamita inflata TaxID=28002 RepID=A0AA86QGC3_9EUKA|nr:Hypothetical protein HINF_LOCUS46489 [Hexamita inflata]
MIYVLISKLVEKEHLIYQSHKDSKTGQLESFGVANPLFVQLFEKEGQYHQVFLDYTHTRYLNNNAQVCCITAQTQSGYTYLLSAYLFKDPQNNAFSGESLEKLETSVKFFHNAIPSLKHCRNVITDQAKAFNHAAALISPHCHSSLCGWHVWQLFKSDFGEKTNQIRYLFFNLLKSPTQADQDYRLRMLKEAIVEVNGKVNQKKWDNLISILDRLTILNRSRSSQAKSIITTSSCAESVNWHKIKKHITVVGPRNAFLNQEEE